MPIGPATGQSEQAWLDVVRAQFLRNDFSAAERSLSIALSEYPRSTELRRVLAGVYQRTLRPREAEAVLRDLLANDRADTATAFALAGLLKEQGRTAAAAAIMRARFADDSNNRDANLAIHAIELLDDCNRKNDASAIAEGAIAVNPEDPRLHAYAGMLEIQLGEFERARQHYLFALEHTEQAWEWHVPIGLSAAQRYTDCAHPDFAMFRDGQRREDLSEPARAELWFALGKAHDDIGDYAEAARQFREGNAIAHRLNKWSRNTWRQTVEGRMAAKPVAHRLEPTDDFMPVFIVGMPRSGTTLLAELLSRHPGVRNRGELPWIAWLAERPALNGNPDRVELRHAAATYAAQSRQDDAPEARWFLDKQPLNFRYLDLILALFPDARIIHCRRSARDTALSLWMQCFREPVQGYACDFDDIALVMRGCERLMAHWRMSHPDSIRVVRYEQLVAAPEAIIAELSAWLGLSPDNAHAVSASISPGISTASLWQARQPVYARSVGRWKNYASCLPELLKFQADEPAPGASQRPSLGNSM